MENKLIPMDPEHGDMPMDDILCCFQSKGYTPWPKYILGYVRFHELLKKYVVHFYEKEKFELAYHFDAYQPIGNMEKGGFLFVKNPENKKVTQFQKFPKQ